MYDRTNAIRFHHHHLPNGCVLTICGVLNHETREVKFGWSIFNAMDVQWIRKIGNEIARDRLSEEPIIFNLTLDEPILSEYITLRTLIALIPIIAKPGFSRVDTLKALKMVIRKATNNLYKRIGVDKEVFN